MGADTERKGVWPLFFLPEGAEIGQEAGKQPKDAKKRLSSPNVS